MSFLKEVGIMLILFLPGGIIGLASCFALAWLFGKLLSRLRR